MVLLRWFYWDGLLRWVIEMGYWDGLLRRVIRITVIKMGYLQLLRWFYWDGFIETGYWDGLLRWVIEMGYWDWLLIRVIDTGYWDGLLRWVMEYYSVCWGGFVVTVCWGGCVFIQFLMEYLFSFWCKYLFSLLRRFCCKRFVEVVVYWFSFWWNITQFVEAVLL